MLLKEFESQIIRLVSGAILTDETRFDFDDIEAQIHLARAAIIKQTFLKNKRISGEWLQTYNAPFNSIKQESNDFVQFSVPRTIPLDELMDGFIYVGDKTGNTAYRRINNRAELANYNLHRITKINNDIPKFIYSQNTIELYGNTMIKELRIDGVFANPTDIPTYNQDVDDYPISEDLISSIKEYLLKSTLIVEEQKQPDLTPDSRETPSKGK